jgi:predicted CopG family antitoxin
MRTHTDTHRAKLGTKNIAISDEAYQRLKALKKPGESFTQVIQRMTRSKGVLDLSGILTKAEASRVSEVVRETRKESSRRLRRTAAKLV